MDTKERILATAHELFHGRSYAAAGIKEIRSMANLQKGSFTTSSRPGRILPWQLSTIHTPDECRE